MLTVQVHDASAEFRAANPDYRFTAGIRVEPHGVVLVDANGRPLVSALTKGGEPYGMCWGQLEAEEPTTVVRLSRERTGRTDNTRVRAALERITPIIHDHVQCPVGQVIPGGTVRGHECWKGGKFVDLRFDVRIDELTEQEAAAITKLLTQMRKGK